MSTKRIEWIDLAKGMSIILVVYGHSGLAGVPYLGDWFAAFRIPFFFMVSGLLFSTDKYPHFGAFLAKRWKTLIRPYFIFSAVCLLAYIYLYPVDFGQQVVAILCKGWGGLALWFIPVLALMEMLYYIIRKHIKNSMVVALILLASAIVGWISYRQGFPNNYNFWFVFTALLFYGGGNLLGPIIKKTFSTANNYSLIGMTSLAFVLSAAFLLNTPKPEFFINHLGSFYTYPAAIGGACFMCCLSVMFSRINQKIVASGKRVFIFFGKNSYIVLAFHQIILLIFAKIHLTNNGSVQRLAMWIILTAIIIGINKYLAFILGRSATKQGIQV